MNKNLKSLGQIAGFGGALTCLGSVVIRLTGMYWIGPFETSTLLQAGMAGMIFGSFCLLVTLTSQNDR